jgi:Mce-associated membrane protein
VPPPRRRPATPPARRPKVAGLNRPAAPAEETHDEPELDTPVIGEDRPRDPKPRPTPKSRDSGFEIPELSRAERRKQEAQPIVPPPTVETEPDVATALVQEPPERQPSFMLPLVLVMVALVVAGIGWWFTLKYSDARVGSGNAALVDVNGTKDLVGAAQQAVTGVLSYKYDEMDKASAQAKQYLSGEAVEQYDKSMQALAGDIQKQKLQVTVTPVSVGVVRLNGDDARVLVFADQIGARADNQQPSGGPTQFAMDMHRADGKWKIVKLDFYDGK